MGILYNVFGNAAKDIEEKRRKIALTCSEYERKADEYENQAIIHENNAIKCSEVEDEEGYNREIAQAEMQRNRVTTYRNDAVEFRNQLHVLVDGNATAKTLEVRIGLDKLLKLINEKTTEKKIATYEKNHELIINSTINLRDRLNRTTAKPTGTTVRSRKVPSYQALQQSKNVQNNSSMHSVINGGAPIQQIKSNTVQQVTTTDTSVSTDVVIKRLNASITSNEQQAKQCQNMAEAHKRNASVSLANGDQAGAEMSARQYAYFQQQASQYNTDAANLRSVVQKLTRAKFSGERAALMKEATLVLASLGEKYTNDTSEITNSYIHESSNLNEIDRMMQQTMGTDTSTSVIDQEAKTLINKLMDQQNLDFNARLPAPTNRVTNTSSAVFNNAISVPPFNPLPTAPPPSYNPSYVRA